ncbi:MAG: DUF559 domain-containing protein [Micrococcaceae bacterium]
MHSFLVLEENGEMDFKSNILRLLAYIKISGHDSALPSRSVKRLCAQGKITKLTRGRYIDTQSFQDLSPEQQYRVTAIALATTRSNVVVSNVTAAVLYGIPVLNFPQHFHFSAHTKRHDGNPLVKMHYSSKRFKYLDVFGVKILSRTYVFMSCAYTLPFEDALVIADGILRTGISKAHIVKEIESLKLHKGKRKVERVLEHCSHLSDSVGESFCRAKLVQLGYTDFVLQYQILQYRVDFAFLQHKVVLEFDGAIKYNGQYGKASDVVKAQNERERLIRLEGWEIVRLTWDMVKNELWLNSILSGYIAKSVH